MADNWEPIRLGNVCEKIGSGATPRGGSDVYLSSGCSLIRSQNIYNGRFQNDGLAFIGDTHAKELDSVTIKSGDLLLNITGDSVARVCQVPDNILPARVNQHVAIIRPSPDVLDARFLLYILISPKMQNHLLGLASAGATRNALTKGMIENLTVSCPPLKEQRAIASVLGALDDKIELNRKMNRTLEAIAQALFKSWFVDFDPVRAKLEGRAPEGMDAETATLFPSEFRDSEAGPIPKGWKWRSLGEVAQNVRVQAQPRDFTQETAYIGLEHMPRKSIALDQWGFADKIVSNKFAFSKGQILFGKLRPYFHKVGIAPVDGVCSTDILVIAPLEGAWRSLVLGHVTSDAFIDYCDTGEGSKMPRTDWGRMASYPIAIPSIELAAAATDITRSLLDKIVANIHENRLLAQTRDVLLPKLISGEIRVRDAEREAGAVNA